MILWELFHFFLPSSSPSSIINLLVAVNKLQKKPFVGRAVSILSGSSVLKCPFSVISIGNSSTLTKTMRN